MTEEELNKYERLVKRDATLSSKAVLLDLIRLARVGLAADEMLRALSIIADGDGDPHEIALQTLSALPKPGPPDDKWLAAIDAAGDVEVGAGIMAADPVAKPGGDGISKAHDWRLSDSSLYDFKCRNCGSTDRSKDADLPCTKPRR